MHVLILLEVLCFYSTYKGCHGRTLLVWSLVPSLVCPHYMQYLDTVIWKRYMLLIASKTWTVF